MRTKSKISNYIEVEFPSRSTNEGFARMTVAAFAAQLDPTLEELGDIKTAVSEAVTNAIVHAYPEKIGKIVLKSRIYEGNILEIIVRDWGRERSGMGFTIMESFMDSLTVRSKPGAGTSVTMKRRISLRSTSR